MLHWSELRDLRPDVIGIGEELLFGHEVGLGFLATVALDGSPRVHPICPVLAGEVYAFIVDGPKLRDLRRDGRYALHCETFPPPQHDDAFYTTGVAEERGDAGLRARLTEQFLAERSLSEPWPGFDTQVLVELMVDRALVTLTEPRAGLPAGHTVWRASGPLVRGPGSSP